MTERRGQAAGDFQSRIEEPDMPVERNREAQGRRDDREGHTAVAARQLHRSHTCRLRRPRKSRELRARDHQRRRISKYESAAAAGYVLSLCSCSASPMVTLGEISETR